MPLEDGVPGGDRTGYVQPVSLGKAVSFLVKLRDRNQRPREVLYE